MNSIEAHSTLNPFGKVSECAKLTIDDIRSPYLLPDITEPEQSYTFSCWLRSDTTGELTVAGKSFTSPLGWIKCVVTFVSDSTDIALKFGRTGTYYIYHPQLELGNKATDWTPAPEDVDDSILASSDEIRGIISEQRTSIMSDAEEITLTALGSYVKTSDHETFKESVETRLSVRDYEIEMNFANTTKQISDISGKLESEISERTKRISFSDDGIWITAGESRAALGLDSDSIIFEKNGVPFGYWDGVDFYSGNIFVDVTNRAQFGNYAYVPRTDGSLSFLKVSNKIGIYARRVRNIVWVFGGQVERENDTVIFEDGDITSTDPTFTTSDGARVFTALIGG